VELCSKCHPFYTGKQKLIDAARRVEKFEARLAVKASKGVSPVTKKLKLEKRAAQKVVKKSRKTPVSLNEA